jgi:hypothetical protein
MTNTLPYQQMGTAARGQTHALFAQTMGYVAATAALFTLGAYLGRNLSGGVGIVAFILAFGCLFGMRFAARRSTEATVALLAAFGLLIGLAVAPTVAYYGSMDPRALWEAGGATALFIAGFGAAGYATRRDLTALARISFWALLALIVAGLVLVGGQAPGRLHGVPRRVLPRPAQLGRAGLPQPELLPRGRQGRPLRRLGRAQAVRYRDPGGVQAAALTTTCTRESDRVGYRVDPERRTNGAGLYRQTHESR